MSRPIPKFRYTRREIVDAIYSGAGFSKLDPASKDRLTGLFSELNKREQGAIGRELRRLGYPEVADYLATNGKQS